MFIFQCGFPPLLCYKASVICKVRDDLNRFSKYYATEPNARRKKIQQLHSSVAEKFVVYAEHIWTCEKYLLATLHDNSKKFTLWDENIKFD